MPRLNAQAKLTLESRDVTPREWTEHIQPEGGRWAGDACGCPDDRCIGHHHLADDPCYCLISLLDEYVANRD